MRKNKNKNKNGDSIVSIIDTEIIKDIYYKYSFVATYEGTFD